MTRRTTILTAVLIAICALPLWAQGGGAIAQPALTGFLMHPTSTDTCSPVRFAFTITNRGRAPILSQNPYSEYVYTLYNSHSGLGLRPIDGRYMIGLSLDGGKDGYPYRWGFRGSLAAGRSARITGFIAIPEAGSFTFTPALLRGDTVVSRLQTRTGTVTVRLCEPYPVSPQGRGTVIPAPGRRVFLPPPPPMVVGPGLYPAFVPYTVNGQLLVSASPFVYTLGAEITWYGNQIIINKPGVFLVLTAGSPYALLNGVPIYLPAPPQFYGGVPFIPPQFISPILGATVFRDPLTGILYIRGPAGF